MEPIGTNRIRDVSTIISTLTAIAMVAILISSGTATDEVLAASGLVTEFVGVGDTIEINFTKIGGSENSTHSLSLPKQSNVVEATMNATGDDIFIPNQVKTFKSAFDFRSGTRTNIIYDTSGLHLDMETLAPFWPGVKKPTGSNTVDVAAGDFNNDGREDFVAVNHDADVATVYYQSNQGTMTTKVSVDTSDQPYCVDSGDFNNDNLDDFAVGTYAGRTVDFFTQKSAGGFTKYSVSISGNALGIGTGDFNNDGLDDVVVALYGKNAVVLRQSSTGTFSTAQTLVVGDSGQYYYYNHDVRDVAVADFNRDGRDDVVFAAHGLYTYNYDYQYYGRIKTYYQSTSGVLNLQASMYGYTGATNIAAGDFSGDGRPDIVISTAYTNKIKVWYQTASGGWSGPTNLGSDGRAYRLEVGDVDGDNKNDVVAASSKPTLLFFKQDQGKVSTQPKTFDLPAGAVGRAVGIGDFNKDGHLDAVTADGSSNSASVFLQRLEYDGAYTSDPQVQPLPIRYINFTYAYTANGGETKFFYSVDGGSNWIQIENGTMVDLVNRTNTFWFRMTFHSASATRYDTVKWITMEMTYQTYPSNVQIDFGRDGSIDWNNSGELIGSQVLTGLEDALTDYIQDPNHHGDGQGYLAIPMGIYSATPGNLALTDLHILYNNASRVPEVVYPKDKGFVNATPTLRFYAEDTDNDMLKYVIQITSTDFNDAFNTITFDQRTKLYDDIYGEGFPAPQFPAGQEATFTLPKAFALGDGKSYKWRMMAFDGYLLSRYTPIYVMKVDSDPPSGYASSPRYSNALEFTVTWTAEDVMPGAGLAPAGTYDVQYRKSTEPTWKNWLMYTTETSAVFTGEEGATYYFRMRARDAVWNEQLFIGGKGDTQTTVDTQKPTVTFADMPNFQDTRSFLVKWIGSDYVPGSGIRHYDVQVRKEDGPWTNWQVEFKSSQAVYTADADKTYHFRARAKDNSGNQGDWSEEFSVRIDATPPMLIQAPQVPYEGDAWIDLTMLKVTFSFFDQESGLREVEVTIGTERGLQDVMPATILPYPEDNTLYLADLPLINSYTYFVGVRASNQANAWSDWSWSGPVLVAIPGPDSTMDYPSGRVSSTQFTINISVTDPAGYNVTLGDLRMRSSYQSLDGWTDWSDWQRISNAKSNVVFEGKRGFRYQFKYRAQNELGSWGEFAEFPDSHWVFINNPPVANGGSSQITKKGDSVEFSADASEDRDGDPMAYHWDFGDGTEQDGLFVNHKYDNAGLYTVELTVSDGYEESTSRVTVLVEEEEQAPGFGPVASMLALLGAAAIAASMSRSRRDE